MDARLEVGLEQQAELMLKMMATLHADSILQALTSSSSTGESRSSSSSWGLRRSADPHVYLSQPGLQRDRRLSAEDPPWGGLPPGELRAPGAVLVHPHAERLLQQALLAAAGPPRAGQHRSPSGV